MIQHETLSDTIGYKVAITFKPFIDPKCSEHMEIVKDMAKSINSAIRSIDAKSIVFTKGYEEGKKHPIPILSIEDINPHDVWAYYQFCVWLYENGWHNYDQPSAWYRNNKIGWTVKHIETLFQEFRTENPNLFP